MNSVVTEFLARAHRLAILSYLHDEVPVGSVVVLNNQIISESENRVRRDRNPCAHAELLALTKAAAELQNERLSNCDLYTSLEPCLMCSGAILQARIRRVYFIAPETQIPGLSQILTIRGHNHEPEVYNIGLANFASDRLLKRYFRKKRVLADRAKK